MSPSNRSEGQIRTENGTDLTARQIATQIVANLDTLGEPAFHKLAQAYLRAEATIDALLPANGCLTIEEALTTFGDTVLDAGQQQG